jgi:hypothetical protein
MQEQQPTQLLTLLAIVQGIQKEQIINPTALPPSLGEIPREKVDHLNS